jgi:hypothetical protein
VKNADASNIGARPRPDSGLGDGLHLLSAHLNRSLRAHPAMVANDYFFSGHTAVAVPGATEVARLNRPRLTALAGGVALFEVATVLVLRAHSTRDVFTGIVTVLGATALAAH